MSTPAPTGRAFTEKPRVTIDQIENENSSHFYIYNRGPTRTGQPSHLLITHTSSQSGGSESFEIPMTFLPQDLTEHAPKEELLRNTFLRKLWANRYIEYELAEVAEKILQEPKSLQEMDRMFMARESAQKESLRNREDPTRVSAEDQRRQEMDRVRAMEQPAAGQNLDAANAGVQGSVVSAMDNHDLSDGERLGLLRNLHEAGILSDADRRYVRERTENVDIRKLVAGV